MQKGGEGAERERKDKESGKRNAEKKSTCFFTKPEFLQILDVLVFLAFVGW